MFSRCALVLVTGLTAMLMSRGNAQSSTAGVKSDVAFTEYSTLSTSAELVRRMFSPLRSLQLNQGAANAGTTLRAQPIDLATERFSVYVPGGPHPPLNGYSLLVFVPPWSRAEVPYQWIPALDRHDMILVTAANSGNDASDVERREPLALLAAHNAMAQYSVDPQRVYVGGFSGGSRVALRLALGYPDVFHGALLNAGSDPIGTADLPLPPALLFHRFQDSARLVYVTGERDDGHLIEDMHSRQSLDSWCVFDVVTVTEPRKGHELADASSFGRALDALLEHVVARPNRLRDCRAHLDEELSKQLQQVQDSFAHGKADSARQLLVKIDARYGGLAAPRSVELAGQ